MYQERKKKSNLRTQNHTEQRKTEFAARLIRRIVPRALVSRWFETKQRFNPRVQLEHMSLTRKRQVQEEKFRVFLRLR